MKRFARSIAAAVALFALLPVPARAAELLIPGGSIIGLRLGSDAITVAAYDETLGQTARAAGLKIGDELVEVNGAAVASVQAVPELLRDCGGQVQLTVRRSGRLETVLLTPAQTADGPRLGVYLRQGVAGIGTVTFYDPATHLFGTLGHGVSDSKGTLLKMTQGHAFTASVQSVKRGKSGAPGQLKGSADGSAICGELFKNTPQGVFGISQQGWKGEPVPTGAYEAIHEGAATIRSTVTGDTPQEYCVEILKIYPSTRPDGRNFLLRVTDPKLLSATGGIVQGM